MHSWFSGDSDENPEENIKKAIGLGMNEICFTDHQDFYYKYNPGYFDLDYNSYFDSLNTLKEKYKNLIDVRIGLEIGLEPHLKETTEKFAIAMPYDFIIASTHLIDGNDPYYPEYFEGRSEKECFKEYFEYIDEQFFNTRYRKQFCESNGFYKRTILTLFGEITFKRRYYFDKKYNDRFYFTDFFLGLPKRKYFDPFICAEICNESASTSYSKAGIITASKIGNRINNKLFISRASSRNIVLNFSIQNDEEYNKRRVDRLFVMLDEKFVGSQFNEELDHMIKASVIFEDTELVYKYKKKENSMDRYKLVNSHTCASIDNELLSDTVDYIYNNYDTDHIKNCFYGRLCNMD